MADFNDPERLKTLRFVVAEARPHFDALLAEATARGYLPAISSSVRNCNEQGHLANTKAKRSWHVFGRAVDIELRKGAPLSDPAKFYRELGEWWEARGGTWGGRWTNIYPQGLPGIAGGAPGDLVHFQWTPAPLTTGVPQALWPTGATCDEVTANAARYLASGGALPGDAKKKADLDLACSWWLLGRVFSARPSGRSRGEWAPLEHGEA